MKNCLKIIFIVCLFSTINIANGQQVSLKNITFTYQNIIKVDMVAGDNLTLDLILEPQGFLFDIYIFKSTVNAVTDVPTGYEKKFSSTSNNIFTFVAEFSDTYTIKILSNDTGKYCLRTKVNGILKNKKKWLDYK